MSPAIDIALYLGVLVTLSYLIYRYARYSRWEDTDAGRAFMGMKVCLLALVLHVLANLVIESQLVSDITRVLVVGGIWVALTYQVRVMVRNQGGFRRDKPVQRWVLTGTEQRLDRRSTDRRPDSCEDVTQETL